MPHAPSRAAGAPKQLVQVRLNDDEIQMVDAFADALSRQSYGAQFSRPEVLKLAALEWLRARQGETPPQVAMPERQPAPPAPRATGVPVAPLTLAPGTSAPPSPAIPTEEATPHTRAATAQLSLLQNPAIPTEEVTPHTKPLSPKQQAVAEASASPLHQPLKAAWQPIVAFLQQRQNVPAQPAEIVAALGCKAESLAAHLRFMGEAGVVGSKDVGQGKEKRKAYFITAR